VSEERASGCDLIVEADANGGCVISLQGVLDFETAPDLAARAAQLFTGHDQITVDFGAVTRSNSAGLALLLEWQRLARRDGQSLHVRNLPESLLNVAKMCELDPLLPSGHPHSAVS